MAIDPEIKLQGIAESLSAGESPDRVTTREFIGWFGARRRRGRVVETIREALGSCDLVTVPDFQQAYIDGEISFELKRTPDGQLGTDEAEMSSAVEDPTHRIGKLDAANKEPTCVSPDASLSTAVTLMMAYHYSQLPVMTSPYNVSGMITWESIGKRLALGQQCKTVRDCMDSKYVIVSSEDSLLSAVEKIEANDYVLVRNDRKGICGIVTSSDLSRQFHRLGEPFFLIGEIENYLRIMIQASFTREEYSEAKDPSDDYREVQFVSDLTFGEYIRLIESRARWEQLRLSMDRKWFIKELKKIRDIRNDVMHFDPDGIQEDELEVMRRFARLLRGLAELKVV